MLYQKICFLLRHIIPGSGDPIQYLYIFMLSFASKTNLKYLNIEVRK